MTLTELRYIVAVARERHFGCAAEACFVSQPTLSVAVKKLEDELDLKLFERGGSEISVTPLGEAIVRQAQVVVEQAAAIKEIAKSGKDPLSGPLKLGIIYTIGPYLLPELVRHASSNADVIRKSFEGSSLETIKHMVASGMGVTVVPQLGVPAEPHPHVAYVPFAEPVPTRRVVLAWRRSFPRYEAIAALRNAVHACTLPGVTRLRA